MSNNAPDYKDNLVFEPQESKMEEYKHEYVHYEFDIRGEKFHLMDNEEYHGSILEGFNEGVNHAEKEAEKMRDLQAEYACKLEEKLRIATEVITQARDTAYDSCQTCPKCELIDKMLTDLLEKIKE